MARRDTSALAEWIKREPPTAEVWTIVEAWVQGLESAPWRYPSTPFPELSFQPEFETRSAIVPNSGGIEVFYIHDYQSSDVDVIWIGRT